MHKILSSKLFSKHIENMCQDVVLKNEGISLVFQGDSFAVISIPTKYENKKIYLKIENINFDIEPLNLYFVDSSNYNRLPENLYPSGHGIAGCHDFLQNPVICISSTYSYHTHPSHRNTPFDMYRNSFQLSSLIKKIKSHIDTDWVIPEGGCS